MMTTEKKKFPVYTEDPEAHKRMGEYEGGTKLEWFGPFEGTLLSDIRTADSYGRWNRGRDLMMRRGTRVFITRLRELDANGEIVNEDYNVLGAGYRCRPSVPAAVAPRWLEAKRVDGELVFVDDSDPAYKQAREAYSRLMSY